MDRVRNYIAGVVLGPSRTGLLLILGRFSTGSGQRVTSEAMGQEQSSRNDHRYVNYCWRRPWSPSVQMLDNKDNAFSSGSRRATTISS